MLVKIKIIKLLFIFIFNKSSNVLGLVGRNTSSKAAWRRFNSSVFIASNRFLSNSWLSCCWKPLKAGSLLKIILIKNFSETMFAKLYFILFAYRTKQ